jgi:hypothetical protein|tara:strand:- start:740 stop:958 length:219 start_codon:yes stop_codon:yes gene_type:complete
MKKILETFKFNNAKELRDCLCAISNRNSRCDLSTAYLYYRGFNLNSGGEADTLSLEEETLTDGSTVNNILIS